MFIPKIRTTSFYSLLNRLLIFSQLCGVAPIFDESHSVSISQRCHHVWCLLILIYIYVVNYKQSHYIDIHLPTIVKFLYLSEFLTNCIIVTVIISSSYYYAKYYHSVPEKLLQLYKQLKLYMSERIYKDTLYYVLHRELLSLSIIAGLFLFSCFAIDLVYYNYDIASSLRSSGAYNVPNVLITLNLGQYWLALRFICLLYRSVNAIIVKHFVIDASCSMTLATTTTAITPLRLLDKHMKSLPRQAYSLPSTDWYKREFANCQQCKSSSVSMGNDSEILEYLREIYSNLDSLLSQLVNAFGYVLMLNFMGSFLDMTVEYFAVYKFFDRPNIDAMVLTVYKILWIVLHTSRMFFVLLINNAIIREKCRTCFILNEVNASTSKDTEHAINRFLLQLMIRKISESACGIIDLDLLFLGAIASALASYVIFLIQIDLGNESLASSNTANHTN